MNRGRKKWGKKSKNKNKLGWEDMRTHERRMSGRGKRRENEMKWNDIQR